MARAAILAGMLTAATALSPVAAQSWDVGVGVGYGGPAYYDPPPVYLYEQPPVLYAPPPIIYEQPPVVYAPAPPPVVPSAVPPDVVFDLLERAGYREFGPMAFRDGVYKLDAVNRRGELVALEVSALSGEVEREYILGAAPPPSSVAPQVVTPASPPSAAAGDPLVVY